MNTKLFPAALVAVAALFTTGCMGAADDEGFDDEGVVAGDEDEVTGESEDALTYPALDVPFKCGVKVIGSTWAAHNPLKAIDFRLPYGSRVDASAGGRVTYGNLGGSSYGRYIVIDHGNGWKTRYAHLAKVYVTSGKVGRGDPIGVSGDSGKAAGAPHLHYEQIYNGKVVPIKLAGSKDPGYPDTKYTYSGGCN